MIGRRRLQTNRMVKELRISANRIMCNVGVRKLCVILDSKNIYMVVKCCGTNGGRRKEAEYGALDMKRISD